MNISKLSPAVKEKYFAYVETVLKVFDCLPEEVRLSIEKVQNESFDSKSYGEYFFDEYVTKSAKKFELCFDICNEIKNGNNFDRAVAKVLCRY